MGISQKNIKLLWGRAASRCAFPECRMKLTQDKKAASASFPLGEQAHIVAKEADGPRGDSPLSTDERDSYFNLILLCPTHHSLIDNNPEDYPIEKLHLIKDSHELWVEETLSQANDLRKTAEEVIYSNLIDSAVESCLFSKWTTWTSWALLPIPQWDADAGDRLLQFRQRVLAAPFPGTLPELEKALITLSIVILEAFQTFELHAEERENSLIATQFYKIREWNPERYHKLAKEFDVWIDKCHNLVFEATKAANWVAEVVRREINPLFFATEGKFIAMYPHSSGPLGLSDSYLLLEYTDEEKQAMPELFLEQLKD